MMNHTESLERFREGMKGAISRARELGIAQQKTEWELIATALEGIYQKGDIFATAKDRGKAQIERDLKGRENKLLATAH